MALLNSVCVLALLGIVDALNATLSGSSGIWKWAADGGAAGGAGGLAEDKRRLTVFSWDATESKHEHSSSSSRKVHVSDAMSTRLTSDAAEMPVVDNFMGAGKKSAKVNKAKASVPLLQHPSKPGDILFFLQWVEQLFNGPDFHHVQVGAFSADDEQDFFASFLKKASWSKLMVEPQPHVYQKLVKFADTVPHMKAVEAAICDKDQTATFYMFHSDIDIYTGYDKRSGKTLPYYTAQLASLNRNHLAKARHAFTDAGLDMDSYIIAREVPCLTVPSILAKQGIDPGKVVSLSIDAEGYDDVILLGTDLNLVRPSVIFFECIHWWGDRARLKKVLKHLADHGYMWWKIGFEIAAFKVGV